MTQREDVLIELTRISQRWAAGGGFDSSRARELRHQIIVANHEHYIEKIPLYRKLFPGSVSSRSADVDNIKNNFMLSADIFKSYEQEWLDARDFKSMTRWLSGLYDKPIEFDAGTISTIEGWINRLAEEQISVVYSSGTSGAFSFVPKSSQDRKTATTANIAYLVPMLAGRTGRSVVSRQIMKNAVRMISAEGLKETAEKGLPGFDAAFLGFREGRMGNQVLMRELADYFECSYFLYDIKITGTAVRALRRGAETEEERHLVDELRLEVVVNREKNNHKLLDHIERSTRNKKKIFMFGAPFQFKELCEVMAAHGRKLTLNRGSLAFFGGGWKSFEGETVDRDTLVETIADKFGLKADSVMEGYSMSEINTLTVRCKHGRFHIPPVLEPVIFDSALNPVSGKDLTGSFGFLDPIAFSYPGFIITNDYVRMIDGGCPCGLSGPGIASIERLPGSEVKGCGGIMGSISA